jgi:tellurite resistance protein TerC
MARLTLRQARRLVIFVIGSTVLLLGLAMLVLPGPGLLFVPLGLAILASEFIWARRLLRRYKHGTASIWRRARDWVRERWRRWRADDR